MTEMEGETPMSMFKKNKANQNTTEYTNPYANQNGNPNGP